MLNKNGSHKPSILSTLSGKIPLVPPNKPKAQLPKNDVLKRFLSFYSTFKSETCANTHESEQHDLVDQEIKTEIKFLFG